MVGPHVTDSAAEAAVTALCEENEIPKEIFDGEENGKELLFSTQTFESERLFLHLFIFISLLGLLHACQLHFFFFSELLKAMV